MKMISTVYLAISVLMVVYCKTDALQPEDMIPNRCYQCSGAACVGSPLTTTCPPERPYCATVAGAPNYTSSLTCATGGELPCSMTYSTNMILEMTCVCDTHLCNAPFTRDLQHELIVFSSSEISKNGTDYIGMFRKQSHLLSDYDSHVYEKITMNIEMTELPICNVSEPRATIRTTPAQYARLAGDPRAEMLKQRTTVPIDDDEDESEGSGADEEGRPRASAAAPAAPASPSSYLPAEENAAHTSQLALFATLPAFFFLLL